MTTSSKTNKLRKDKKEEDYLTLKWGTLKAWSFHSEKGKALLKKYFDIGANMSAAMQEDTPEQKQIICQLIDEGNFKTVCNDWDGKNMTKVKAKKYVMEY